MDLTICAGSIDFANGGGGNRTTRILTTTHDAHGSSDRTYDESSRRWSLAFIPAKSSGRSNEAGTVPAQRTHAWFVCVIYEVSHRVTHIAIPELHVADVACHRIVPPTTPAYLSPHVLYAQRSRLSIIKQSGDQIVRGDASGEVAIESFDALRQPTYVKVWHDERQTTALALALTSHPIRANMPLWRSLYQ